MLERVVRGDLVFAGWRLVAAGGGSFGVTDALVEGLDHRVQIGDLAREFFDCGGHGVVPVVGEHEQLFEPLDAGGDVVWLVVRCAHESAGWRGYARCL